MAYENHDFEPTIKDVTFKPKKSPRWLRRQQRRVERKEHVDFCELINKPPEPLTGGQISAAKLKGSPEYNEKRIKMTERRAHVRTHVPEELITNVRWCGCSTEIGSQHCCLCAEYGAPDMKLSTSKNKWEYKYQNHWVPNERKRKQRPHDKPCKSFIQYNTIWPRANKPPIKKFGSRFDEYCAQEDNEPHAYCYMNTSFYYA